MSKQVGNPPPYSQTPPAAGFTVPQPQQHHHHHQPPATVIGSSAMGPTPQRMVCPSCHAEILTKMQYEPTTKTHLSALILCLIGCYFCCCIPYCMDTCQNANHYCPSCSSFLGTYSS